MRFSWASPSAQRTIHLVVVRSDAARVGRRRYEHESSPQAEGKQQTMARLSTVQRWLLAAVAAGDILKVHRTVDGEKIYRLHPLDGAPEQEILPRDVETLLKQGLLDSNMKFPAATFLITPKGVHTVARLQQQ